MTDRLRPRPASHSRLAAVLAALCVAGCAQVPPWLERSYARVGVAALAEELAVDRESERGPFPGVAVNVGTLVGLADTRSVALEAGLAAFEADAGDLDGYGFRWTAGPRWQWNMGGRVRPSVGTGLSWTDFRFDDIEHGFDPSGPGGYLDVGLDWMLTPHFALAARIRDHLRYEDAARNKGIQNGLEFVLETVWRF
ncbi:MAG: porin family protein [Planctomycetes bacterium]|nr:porin family protein [Planctomycetota bacterium]